MKKLLFVFIGLCLAVSASAAIRVFDSNNAEIGDFVDVKLNAELKGQKSSGKLLLEDSGLKTQTAMAVSASLVASQCGNTVIGTAGSVATLPEASTVLGCRYTFVVNDNNAAGFGINPADASDFIVTLTNAQGDSVTNSVSGSSFTIEAVSADRWNVIGKEQGTWIDSN